MTTHAPSHAVRWLAVLLLAPPCFAGDARKADAVAGSFEQRYGETVRSILSSTLESNDAWSKMEQLCDGIGHRISGSSELDRALEWAARSMRADGLANVRLEKVSVPRWVRGNESAVLLEPRETPLAMLGLGMSVGTPPEGITGEVVVVKDEEEFEAKKAQIKGHIVLFNNAMPPYSEADGAHYGTTVRFRGKGPSMAAREGAIACLVRSVTAHSLRSPHTGATRYEEGVPKIPAAAISTEDAQMIARLRERGEKVVVRLKMEAQHMGQVDSANVIGELVGREKPEEVIVIGGHIDSWDVGQGAHDDGAGCVMAMEALNVLKKLNLTPRRTIRVVLFTNEENGLAGGKAYLEKHKGEMAHHIAAIESDSGGFKPEGYSIACADETRQQRAREQMTEILSILQSIGPMKTTLGEGGGADINPMKEHGVLLMGHEVDGSKYFDYHHTHTDTLDKVDPTELSQNVATLVVVSYILADMEERFGGELTESKPVTDKK